jgi:hypothetical protein
VTSFVENLSVADFHTWFHIQESLKLLGIGGIVSYECSTHVENDFYVDKGTGYHKEKILACVYVIKLIGIPSPSLSLNCLFDPLILFL